MGERAALARFAEASPRRPFDVLAHKGTPTMSYSQQAELHPDVVIRLKALDHALNYLNVDPVAGEPRTVEALIDAASKIEAYVREGQK